MRTPTPRRLWNYLTRRLRLKRYLQSPGDGRRQPQIPAQALLWAMLVGQILREYSFHAVEALVRSSARRHLCLRVSFGDDALGYSPSGSIRPPCARPWPPSSGRPNGTRPSTIAAGSVWPWTAPVRDGGGVAAALCAAPFATRLKRWLVIAIISP